MQDASAKPISAPRRIRLGADFNKEVTKVTLKKKLPMWAKFGHENLERLKHKCEKKGVTLRHISIDALRSDYILKPCLIVGWGNSFHETVDMIKEIPRDKCMIIATDRPLRKLIENGVIPDLVVNLDSGKQIKKEGFYKTLLSEAEICKLKICLALTTDPKEVMWFHGRKYWYVPGITQIDNTLSQDLAKASGFPIVATGGSVGTTAMIIAQLIGARPINLIGMDFGRELDDEGNDPKATQDRLATSKEFTETVKSEKLGERTFTLDPVLHAYAFATRDILMHFQMDVYNCSGGILHGPYINTVAPTPEEGGTSRERLQAVINGLKEFKLPEKVQDIRDRFCAGKLNLPISFFLRLRGEHIA